MSGWSKMLMWELKWKTDPLISKRREAWSPWWCVQPAPVVHHQAVRSIRQQEWIWTTIPTCKHPVVIVDQLSCSLSDEDESVGEYHHWGRGRGGKDHDYWLGKSRVWQERRWHVKKPRAPGDPLSQVCVKTASSGLYEIAPTNPTCRARYVCV